VTVVEDRIEMAESSDPNTLDELFERLETMPVPDGYRVEIVGGTIYMTPQRDTHWEIIRKLLWGLEDHFGRHIKVFSDVRIDFPGDKNGFCPDLAKLRDSAEKDSAGHWSHEDVEFVAEVISAGTAPNDYGPKKAAYAAAEVPVYLVADPYQGRCHVYTNPKGGDYATETKVPFGDEVDLTGTPLGLVLKTDEFPRD
jgi:Uma2 family endonuclease